MNEIVHACTCEYGRKQKEKEREKKEKEEKSTRLSSCLILGDSTFRIIPISVCALNNFSPMYLLHPPHNSIYIKDNADGYEVSGTCTALFVLFTAHVIRTARFVFCSSISTKFKG